MSDTTTQIIKAAADLSARLYSIPGMPVAPAVAQADPTVYCGDYYRAYLARAASGARRCLIVGMNPGPHGMAQTGVPFGDAPNARRILRPWLLSGFVGGRVPQPSIATITGPDGGDLLHVAGLEYHRGEESGKRLWSVLEQVCGSLDAALDRCLVINYCPLVFLDVDGRNVTPASWPKSSTARQAMERHCDQWLLDVVRILQPRHVVGVGGYAAAACQRALAAPSPNPIHQIWQMRHPSSLAGSAQAFTSAAIPVLTQACGVDP